ncbi:hypothetical protein S7S_15165 [Isoalcanivorax pacificus W11-5]|uniref:Xylose isomerase-like TIM barrel domain-containing protein n=2 Tax=Isoalcanivorax TaxID=3020833 RepID=A0A0B4XRS7_9GAMM|nr:hypothetical protein S7S_15165 [Isoalcanivorax pacificus W11-5]
MLCRDGKPSAPGGAGFAALAGWQGGTFWHDKCMQNFMQMIVQQEVAMQLQLYKTLWGHTGSYADAVQQAQDAGFQGIECAVPAADADLDALARALDGPSGHLPWIAEICTAGSYVPERCATLVQHLDSLDDALRRCRVLAPVFVNCMGGCDAWPLARSLDFFRGAMALADKHGLTISFETHRGRSLFNPWRSMEILDALPDLKITCDFSHWCVVAERLMDSELEAIALAAEHAHHIHARVGYDQGPQVPHPAAPEYAEALASHQRCWEQVWAAQRRRGYHTTTLTPEFGPDGYLHQLPFTGAPVADLWQVNTWIAATERDHFRAVQALDEAV